MRFREFGWKIGEFPPGPFNAITDVGGVQVGHTTLISGAMVRTGVTVVLPHSSNLYLEKVPAAVHTINGFGKATGFEQVRELGVLEAPIALTNTLNVGLVLDAMVEYMLTRNPEIGVGEGSGSINVIVGETNDSYLNDLRGRHVRREHVCAALEGAIGGLPAEGAVGAGAGTMCYGWKGGIGTSSRVLPPDRGGFTLGALLQSNFGSRGELVVAGRPAGRLLTAPGEPSQPNPGSVMIILATDAPLSELQLRRLCVRAVAGLARTGATLRHGSGDFVIAFSVGRRIAHHPGGLTGLVPALLDEATVMNALFQAAVEAVEESVLNSLTGAATLTGRDGHIAHALPVDQLAHLLNSA